MLANVLVAQAARRARSPSGCRRPARASATPRAWPARRRAIWRDIYLSNADALVAAIDDTIARLERGARRARRRATSAAVTSWNDAARDDRRRLLEADLAGGEVIELRVSVPNRPGVVAEVALALGRAQVNIVDMALYPAADNTTGSIALWIAGERRRGARREGLIGGARLHGGAAVTVLRARAGPACAARSPRRPTSRSRTAPRCSPAMTSDPVRVTNYLEAADTLSTLRAVQALGAIVERRDGRARVPRPRPARGGAADRRDRRRQRRHADAAAARAGSPASTSGVLDRSTATSRSGAGRSTASPSRCGRWARSSRRARAASRR